MGDVVEELEAAAMERRSRDTLGMGYEHTAVAREQSRPTMCVS